MAKRAKRRTPFRRWLDGQGLTLEDFAKETGLSFYTVQRYSSEAGRRPRDLTAKAIADRFPDCPLVGGRGLDHVEIHEVPAMSSPWAMLDAARAALERAKA